jgi:hypothetical protein
LNYWSPLGLNATTYEYASPSGALPASLNKRPGEYNASPLLLPCTVLAINSSEVVTESTLSAIIDSYATIDDVWTPGAFLGCLLLQSTVEDLAVNKTYFASFLVSHQIEHAFMPTPSQIRGMVLSENINVYPKATNCGLTSGSYVATLAGCGCLSVGFTSVYQIQIDEYEAYYQIYGPQNYATDMVQKFLDGGAQMVGTPRSVAFALRSPQNGREVDFLDPWNSRGDEYQTTGGSSSGSGAPVTAYDWIDFAVGKSCLIIPLSSIS